MELETHTRSATGSNVPTRSLADRARIVLHGVRRRGVREIARVIDHHVPERLVLCDVLHVTQLVKPRFPNRPTKNITLRTMEPREITEIDRLFPRPPGEYRRRLEADHKGFLAEVNGKVAGIYWINLSGEHVEAEKFCRFRLPPDTAWAYDAAVLPEWQLSRVFAALLFHSLDYARQHERTRICGYASWFNKESIRAHYSFGHEPLLRVFVMNLLGMRVYRISKTESGTRPPAITVRAGRMATIDLAP